MYTTNDTLYVSELVIDVPHMCLHTA
jgi:hypothetical protein